ncbi:class I SAM-dependent methyltransferase [uncultured Methanobrevibacter sp.]|uniref:methyltransferase domain-containing protein n=1 Tax=uncultured Methanobrevibacter sp. TaxID=253161 RepID=UPI002613135C|nr:class I SAM-dependent methyltransferase [uncultured Methanobrevibacter sp.]
MIKISYDIKEYRKELFNILNNGNNIIELGCHVGKTTKLILDKFDDINIISIDNSPEAIAKMEKLTNNYSNLTFISGDVRRHEILLEVFKLIQDCDILSVDLGGGYHPDTVFKVFYIWSSTFKPNHSIIRNKGLVDFCNSAIVSCNDFKSQNGHLESYIDEGIPPQIKEFELWTPSLREK